MSPYGPALLLLLLLAPSSSLLGQIGNVPTPTSRPPRTPPKQAGTLGGTQVCEGLWASGGLGYGSSVVGRAGPRDSALYLRQSADGLPVHRLELTTRSLRRTNLRDHDFSPSGKYYLSRPFESESLLGRSGRRTFARCATSFSGSRMAECWMRQKDFSRNWPERLSGG